MSGSDPAPPRVGLLVTCLVDLLRPRVGFAAAKLIEDTGALVEVPRQTCCGQPAYNSGDRATARALAEQVIGAFEGYDFIVAPSGSCAGMMKTHYPDLFAGDPAWEGRVAVFTAKVFELTQFLVEVMGVSKLDAFYDGTVTYHDSCSGLRELGIRSQPRKLLSAVAGVTLAEMADTDTCCGFGGTFAIKFPEVSGAMVDKKVANILATGAPTVLAGDLGCLLNIAGRLQRLGHAVKVRHIAEVLAGMAHEPAIGEPEQR